jgi:hypothetical protein
MTGTLDVMFGKLRDAAAAHDDDLRNPAAAQAPHSAEHPPALVADA